MTNKEARDDERGEQCTDECGWCGQNMIQRDDEPEARRAMIESAVRAITPNVANETAAWNTWNNLASDPDFVRAIVTLHAEQHGYRKHPEPEMEYGVRYLGEDRARRSEEHARTEVHSLGVHSSGAPRASVIARTKEVVPGPWVPVGEGEQ